MHLATLIPDWNSLESVRRAHGNLELLAIAFFALLVAFDILAHFAEDKKARERLFERIGLGCFAVAVAFEIAAYVYGQRNDHLSEQLINSLDAKASDAFGKASKANNLAEEAKGKAEAVREESDALTVRLSETKRAVDFQTPRRLLLFAVAPKLVSLLKPYAGQRVYLSVCESNRRDFETMDTWGIIAQILANEKPAPGVVAGANWKEVPTNLNIAKSQCGGMGIGVGISTKASPRTRKAAKALSEALFKSLPASIYNHFGENDPEMIRRVRSMGFLNEGSPLVGQLSDPELIIVAIEAHPTQ